MSHSGSGENPEHARRRPRRPHKRLHASLGAPHLSVPERFDAQPVQGPAGIGP
jgi:hypothetical protein